MIFPIQVYTKEGCLHCDTLKLELTSRNIDYLEYEVGKDVSSGWFKDHYPGVKILPLVVTETGLYAGPKEVQKLLNEYGSDFGKRLLNESR